MSTALVFAFLFFIGCIVGWGIELVFRRFLSKNNPDGKWINPGFLVGPWLPIYGLGLCGMYVVSLTIGEMTGELIRTGSKAAEAADAAIVLVIMTMFMTLIELVAGLLFTKLFNVKLWDYSEEKLNFKGIICPKFSLFWGILGCFYYFVINPYILDGIIWLSQHLTFSFFIGFFFGVFAMDLAYSFNLASRLRRFTDEQEIIIKYEELKAHNARHREEMKQKAHFFFALRADQFREALDKYADLMK